MLEHPVSGIFGLPAAPRIRKIELLNHRTIPLGESIQVRMQGLAVHLFCELIGHRPVRDLGKGVIVQFKRDARLLQLSREPRRPVAVEL